MDTKKIFNRISPTHKKISVVIDPKLTAVGSRLDSMEPKLNALQPKLDYIDQKIFTLEKKIDQIVYKDELYTKKKKIEVEDNFSNLGEEAIIDEYLNALPIKNQYCVDIAASDGVAMSNTLFLFKRQWGGIAVEFDSKMFAELSFLYKDFPNVNLVKAKITPGNIVSVLKTGSCPKNFSFLNFDIDSYDFFVLDELLSEFRPSLICTEINEKIPPPISFTVKYDPDHFWKTDHFFGQSISKCYELCEKHKYDIVKLHYNNLFLVPKEINVFDSFLPEKAFEEGYLNKKDRKEKFPWNSDMEELLTMSKEKGIEFLNKKFEEYKGKYILE
jgi:hypothetical protein